MLSPTEPAFSIFGANHSTFVVNIAHSLAEVSGFPVVVRPPSDNPALTILCVISFCSVTLWIMNAGNGGFLLVQTTQGHKIDHRKMKPEAKVKEHKGLEMVVQGVAILSLKLRETTV